MTKDVNASAFGNPSVGGAERDRRPRDFGFSAIECEKWIRSAILRGDLMPGERLVERDLGSLLGVSKTPIREALRALASSGLVTAEVNRGASVRRADREFATSVYEVRLLLEVPAVKMAVPHHTPDTIRRLHELLDKSQLLAAGDDPAELSDTNREFHRQLYAPCRNERLRAILDGLQDEIALISVVGWRTRSTWKQEFEEHRAVLARVESGDAAGAARLLRRHIERFSDRFVDRF
jgi:DNA-binding GntR family transcriptional regulator